MRRVGRLIYVVHAEQGGRVSAVEFDKNLLSFSDKCGSRSNRRSKNDATAGGYIAGLHHRPMHRTEKSIAHRLRQHGKMHVEKAGLARVDAGSKRGVGLIWRAKTDRARFC